MIFDAVGGHDEDQAFAIADRAGKLLVPVQSRLQVALVQPNRDRRRAGLQLVVQLQSEVEGIDGGVTDEVMDGHGWTFEGVAKWPGDKVTCHKNGSPQGSGSCKGGNRDRLHPRWSFAGHDFFHLSQQN